MTPAQKRQVIRELRRQGLSLRLALELVKMARATFYRQGRGHPEEDGLRERLRELAHAQVSFGYRRITAVLRRQGWQVNLMDGASSGQGVDNRGPGEARDSFSKIERG